MANQQTNWFYQNATRHKRAKEITGEISSHEVIGYASQYSDDGFDGLTRTNLTKKDGTVKHPTTNK